MISFAVSRRLLVNFCSHFRWRAVRLMHILVCFVLVLSSATAHARLTDNAFTVSYFEDAENKLSIDDIIRQDSSMPWVLAQSTQLTLGLKSTPYWVKLVLPAHFFNGQNVLSIEYPLLDVLDGYIVHQQRILKSYETGFGKPFDSRPVPHRFFVFPLSDIAEMNSTILEPRERDRREPVTVYLRILSAHSISVPLAVSTEVAFWRRDGQEFAIQAIFYGAIFIMFFYNLFVYFTTRDQTYGWYALFIFAVALFQTAYHGSLLQFVAAPLGFATSHAVAYSGTFAIICAAKFLEHFLNNYLKLTLLSKPLKVLSLVTFLFGCAIAIIGLDLAIKVMILLAFTIILLVVIICAYLMALRVPQTALFVAGWSFLFVALSILLLMTMGYIPITKYSLYAFQASTVIEAVLFSFVLSGRVRMLETTQLALQQSVELNDLRSRELAALQLVVKEKQRSQLKGEMLAIMSHEIRTPLNGIIGITDLLMETDLNEQQRQWTTALRSSEQSLRRIVNDILNYSRLESGYEQLETVDFDLAQLIPEIITLCRNTKLKGDVLLVADIEQNLPALLLGDQHKLRQVIMNLVTNALKFTEHGRVTLKVSLCEEDNQNVTIEFAVMDTGIGIPAEKQSSLFSPFEQADVSTSRRYGGTGLGLAICNKLVDLLGGKIHVESEEGEGSKFWFKLCFALPAGNNACSTALAPSHDANGWIDLGSLDLEILFAEDNLTNQMVLQKLLEKMGVSWHKAASGREAVALYETHYEKLDCILMDCEMPDVDGYEATVQIRQFERDNNLPNTPIIAVTAHAIPEYLDRCMKVGMTDTLSKPIERQLLNRKLIEIAKSKK